MSGPDPEGDPLPVISPSGELGRPPASTFAIAPLDRSGIGCVLAVISGKGGVGKTFVTALLASEFRRAGASVGVLDADITGPSMARVLGVARIPQLSSDGRSIEPLRTATGIMVMSMASVTAASRIPLLWRGPMVNSAIRGLFKDTRWPPLDYLLVDLPPGTSDAPLTVFQSLAPEAVVLVTAPTQLSGDVVEKSAHMARTFRAPLLGLIENMAYLVCPHQERIELFGPSRGAEFAQRWGIPYLGSLPIYPGLPVLADEGRLEDFHDPAAEVLARRVRTLLDRVRRAAPSGANGRSPAAPDPRGG